jgi:replicative DNA helicase
VSDRNGHSHANGRTGTTSRERPRHRRSALAADRSERALLGACLRHPAHIPEAAAVVRPGDFRSAGHVVLWECLLALQESGLAVDLVTVGQWLYDRGKVEDAGGYGYLGELWDAAPVPMHLATYAAHVHDAALRRRVVGLACELTIEAENPTGPVDELLARAERDVLALADRGAAGEAVPVSAALDAALDRYDARATGTAAASCLPTGLVDLDHYLAGGLQDGELVILAARPSVGKTALGLQLARHAAHVLRAPVHFASLEQSLAELGDRLLVASAGVDYHRLRRGMLSREDAGRMVSAAMQQRAAPLSIDDAPAQRVLRIGAAARRVKARSGLRLLVVDYLQLVEPDDPRANRNDQVGGTARRLKALARELRCPLLCLCQLNRGSEQHPGPPRLSDLRDSGEIEQHADTVLMLHRPESPPGVVEIHLKKQRNGPLGEVTLTFDGPRQTFLDFANGPGFDPM